MKHQFNQFLCKNLVPFCRGANVWDFCCGTGINGLFALEYHANHVTFSDVRQKTMLDYAKQIPDNCTWKYFDADKIDQYTQDIPMDELDIILYCGHFYHARNHYEIAKMLTSTSAERLILETKVHIETDDGLEMYWHLENTERNLDTYEEGREQSLVGAPNKLLSKYFFTTQGWKLEDQDSEFADNSKLYKHRFSFTR